MSGSAPTPVTAQDAAAALAMQQAGYTQGQPGVGMQGYNQTAEFFLSNYRLGKTLGVGSFGKVRRPASVPAPGSR